jgi:hypothetical protein
MPDAAAAATTWRSREAEQALIIVLNNRIVFVSIDIICFPFERFQIMLEFS